MQWDGATPYTTTVTQFNGRDQAVNVKQYAGAEGSGTYQETTLTYDGHGRLKTQHRPEQIKPDTTLGYTTYNYNQDDSISSVVDARGAKINYGYNTRGLVNLISSDVSNMPAGTTVPLAPAVGFDYDALGNRKYMTDGLGRVDYEYNQLSQMMAEVRQFTDNLPNAPLSNNKYKLEYSYQLSGQLKSYKDPFGQQINYTHDKIGRLNSVTGTTAFAGVTTYASNPQYRAWGGLQGLSYGNNTQMSLTFNNRLQASAYQLTNAGQYTIASKTYDYYADGKLRKLDDAVDEKFDRLNTFDHLGRPKTGKSGLEASGGTVAPDDMKYQLPYRQSYTFNAFNNLVQRNNLHWGVESRGYNQTNNLSYTYQNNRITNAGWTYDADGRVLVSSAPDEVIESTYDAKGQITRLLAAESDINRYTDGNEREAKRKKRKYVEDQNGNGSWVEEFTYYLRSSVMGGEVITEADATGRKRKTFVKAAGATLAWQNVYHNPANNTQSEYLSFEQWDASGMSYRSTGTYGVVLDNEGWEGAPAELDPLGGNAGLTSPYIQIITPAPEYPSQREMSAEMPMYVNGQQVTATMDGMAVPLSFALSALSGGSAIPAALAPYQHLPGFNFQSNGLGIFNVSIPRQVGWNVTYNGANDTRGTASPVYVGSYNFTWNITVEPYSLQTKPVPPKKYDSLTKDQIKAVRDILADVIDKNEFCKSFVSKFLDEIGNVTGVKFYSNDILAIFDKLDKLGHIYGTKENTRALAWGGGSAGSGSGLIIFDIKATTTFVSLLVPALIHELTHAAPSKDFAGGFSHKAMDQAAYNVIKNAFPDFEKFNSKRSYFAEYLEKHCKPTKDVDPFEKKKK